MLKWACKNGCPWDERMCQYAARPGCLDILIWARVNGFPWNANTCEAAAEGGHLEFLKWAVENGCPWNARTCEAAAARHGHFEVLKWAEGNGCPWNEDTCMWAANNQMTKSAVQANRTCLLHHSVFSVEDSTTSLELGCSLQPLFQISMLFCYVSCFLCVRASSFYQLLAVSGNRQDSVVKISISCFYISGFTNL
ncbi:unknown protein [Seminavis robusta]|uniref:Ankyrin repeat-containing domain n=1 Tax=Seminavis robusta TaxID=568900 RepID=A0A9N8EU72_9STRA|nr:unknown protein [Seminavis robusta]|eukprot:Sro1962_g308111.1  (195) ;mRNA; r:8846-9430